LRVNFLPHFPFRLPEAPILLSSFRFDHLLGLPFLAPFRSVSGPGPPLSFLSLTRLPLVSRALYLNSMTRLASLRGAIPCGPRGPEQAKPTRTRSAKRKGVLKPLSLRPLPPLHPLLSYHPTPDCVPTLPRLPCLVFPRHPPPHYLVSLSFPPSLPPHSPLHPFTSPYSGLSLNFLGAAPSPPSTLSSATLSPPPCRLYALRRGLALNFR